jgi:hydroxyquinol 1,2-dioxygenase
MIEILVVFIALIFPYRIGTHDITLDSFVGDDPYIIFDAVPGAKQTLVALLERINGGKTVWRSPFDIVLTPVDADQ